MAWSEWKKFSNSEKELLWSNSSSTFAENSTISLNLSDYKYVVIGCVYGLSAPSYIVYNFVEVGSSAYCVVNNGVKSGACNSRLATVNTSGIKFTNVTAGDRCVPIEVYGIK